MASLHLNRSFQNATFQSWKIGSNFVNNRVVLDLPDSVFAGASDAVDYLHTRASVLRNHLFDSQGRLFVATRADEDTLVVYEVVRGISGDADAAGLELVKAAAIPPTPADSPANTAVEAALHCSLAVVAPVAAAAATAAGTAAVDPSPAAATPAAAAEVVGAKGAGSSLLLVSTGQGDLVLLQQSIGNNTAGPQLSNVIFPLRPRPPAIGVRPFTIESAWATSDGHIRCVLAAISNVSSSSSGSSSSHVPHAHHWICDTWLVTLFFKQQQQQQQQQEGVAVEGGPVLQVVDCQLLLASRSPPAAAVGYAAAAAAAAAAGGGGGSSSSERLLIVGEPALEEDELPAGFFRHQPTLSGPDISPPAAAAAGGGGDDATVDVPAANSSSPAAAAAAAATAAAVAADEDLDDMDIDPRTLQQAAARLAQYTTETQLGDLPQQQWTDVFKESGPGDLGTAAEADPAVDVMLFTAAAAAAATAGSSSSSSINTPGKLSLSSSLSCGPYRLLAVQIMLHDTVSNSPELLLGVTDDVDCAVVAASWQQQQGSNTSAASGDGKNDDNQGAVITVLHQASLPALAYVIAGKTQRRHLLLGGSSCSPVCAVLVEGQKYAYLYGQVPKGSSHGKQQIVDMELPVGTSIMGARLLHPKQQQQPVDAGAGSSAAPGQQSSSNNVQLLLLTQSQLICYTLKEPQ